MTEISPSAADRELSESLPGELADFEFIPYDKASSLESNKKNSNDDENLFAKKAEQRKKEDKIREEKSKSSYDTPAKEASSMFLFIYLF